MDKITWLSKTNQWWKVVVSLILQVIAIAMFFSMILSIKEVPWFRDLDTLALCLGFLGFGIIGFYFLFGLLKCPVCGFQPAWFFLTKMPQEQWIYPLFRIGDCPNCLAKESGAINETAEKIRIFEADTTKNPRPLVITAVGLFAIVALSVMILYRVLGLFGIFKPIDSKIDTRAVILLLINIYWLVCGLATFRLKEWARRGMVIGSAIFIFSALINFWGYDEIQKIGLIVWIILLVLLMSFYSHPKIISAFREH